MRAKIILAVLAVVVVVALVAGAGVLLLDRRRAAARDTAASAAAHELAAAWSAGHLRSARYAGTTPAVAAERYAALTSGLSGAAPRVRVRSTTRTGSTATARLAVSWAFGSGWHYTTTAHLAPVRAGDPSGRWGARFTPALVEPSLRSGQHLSLTRTAAVRGEILGRDGSAIVSPQPVVQVGVEPSRTKDPAGLATQLAQLLGVDATALTKAITTAAPTAFVPVITLRQSDYDGLSAQLKPLPGTVFSRSTLPLAPTGAFARALLGRVGPATAEIVKASHGRVVTGDTTGTSGLQRTDDAQLAGTPATTVTVVDSAGKSVGKPFTSAAVAGKPVRLSLDTKTQEAADAALATATDADGGEVDAALVAVDISSGDVTAVANTPTTGTDRALMGRYPPGSTFKTVTTTALLGKGITPDTTVDCTPTATVDGRSFKNFEGEAFGAVPFRTDFAQSCNTAFVGLSSKLGADDLSEAATSLGLGGSWAGGSASGGSASGGSASGGSASGGSGGLGLEAFTGSVPSQPSAVDRAAASIGQGTVLASPLAMAVEVSTVARGTWVAPTLVKRESSPAGTSTASAGATTGASSSSATASSAPAAPEPDAAKLAVVRDLMRSVVTSGTASALATVPGAPVYAKTGTAEYGTQDPPQVDAWTIGFQGTTAFAVLVENGTSGATNAVPVAGAFLRALGS